MFHISSQWYLILIIPSAKTTQKQNFFFFDSSKVAYILLSKCDYYIQKELCKSERFKQRLALLNNNLFGTVESRACYNSTRIWEDFFIVVAITLFVWTTLCKLQILSTLNVRDDKINGFWLEWTNDRVNKLSSAQ